MHLIYLMVKGSSEKFQVYSVAVFHTEEFSLCTFRRSPSSLQVLLMMDVLTAITVSKVLAFPELGFICVEAVTTASLLCCSILYSRETAYKVWVCRILKPFKSITKTCRVFPDNISWTLVIVSEKAIDL